MRTVELTTNEFKTVPGYSTEISVSRWKGKIDALLYEIEDQFHLHGHSRRPTSGECPHRAPER